MRMVELLPFRERSCILESVYIMTVMTMEANRVLHWSTSWLINLRSGAYPLLLLSVQKEFWN